jgi:hypothetical protein
MRRRRDVTVRDSLYGHYFRVNGHMPGSFSRITQVQQFSTSEAAIAG